MQEFSSGMNWKPGVYCDGQEWGLVAKAELDASFQGLRESLRVVKDD